LRSPSRPPETKLQQESFRHASKPAAVFISPTVQRPGRHRNFCLFVAKKGKAYSRLNADLHNMVTGKELTAGYVDRTMPLTVDGNTMRIAGHKAGVSVRITAKLCSLIESQVPVGYEDEGGFHYGTDMAG